jgi:hypothetical protein
MAHYFRQAIEETLPWLSSFGADPTGELPACSIRRNGYRRSRRLNNG